MHQVVTEERIANFAVVRVALLISRSLACSIRWHSFDSAAT